MGICGSDKLNTSASLLLVIEISKRSRSRSAKLWMPHIPGKARLRNQGVKGQHVTRSQEVKFARYSNENYSSQMFNEGPFEWSRYSKLDRAIPPSRF